MDMSKKMKVISQILVIAIINLTCSYSYAWVDPTATYVAIHKKSIAQISRQQLLDLTDRQEVIDQLTLYGVSKKEAINRINSLTDEEIEAYLAKIDELPSGGRAPNDLEMLLAFIVYSPMIALMYPIAIIIKTPTSIVCLNHLNDYHNCFINNGGLFGSTYPVVKKDDSKPMSCLEPCYSAFDDCMDSVESLIEQSQCQGEKAACIQQC